MRLEKLASFRWKHLVDQKAHPLRSHELGAVLSEDSSAFRRCIVGADLRVDLLAVHRGIIQGDPDLSRMQPELFCQLRDAALGTSADVAQCGRDFPDVAADGQCRSASGRTVAKDNAGEVRRIQTLGDEAFEQGTFRDAFCCRLVFETPLEVGIETVRRHSARHDDSVLRLYYAAVRPSGEERAGHGHGGEQPSHVGADAVELRREQVAEHCVASQSRWPEMPRTVFVAPLMGLT